MATRWINPEDLDEVKLWAFGESLNEPCQDFDLHLARSPTSASVNLFLALATNEACPQREFFVDVLYLMIARACADGRLATEAGRRYYERLVDLANGLHDKSIKTWRYRARYVVQHPLSFDASDWWVKEREGTADGRP